MQGPDFDLQRPKQAKQFWREAATTGMGVQTLGPCCSRKQRSGVGHAKITATQRMPHAPWRNQPLPWDGMTDAAVPTEARTLTAVLVLIPTLLHTLRKRTVYQSLHQDSHWEMVLHCAIAVAGLETKWPAPTGQWCTASCVRPPLPQKTKRLEAECV